MLPSTNDATFEGPGKSPRARRTPQRIAVIGVHSSMVREDVYKNSSTTADILMDQCRILAALFCVLSSAMPSGSRRDNGARGALPMPNLSETAIRIPPWRSSDDGSGQGSVLDVEGAPDSRWIEVLTTPYCTYLKS